MLCVSVDLSRWPSVALAHSEDSLAEAESNFCHDSELVGALMIPSMASSEAGLLKETPVTGPFALPGCHGGCGLGLLPRKL